VRRHTTRRSFLKQTALAGFGVWVSGRSLQSQSKSPNEKLNIGIIGCGGKGHSDTQCVATENIVALCDVDQNNAAGCFKEFPNAKKYTDFRKMLDEEKSLDAVVVATPDHTHAPASVMAMKLGKHVYCQKPLTHSVFEARTMRETAAKMKVVTQMGNQGSAEPGLRRAVEIIQAGVLGPVRQVHVWSNRPIWPQGMDRPEGSKPVPSHLDWGLWLGPAPERPYNDGYCPFAWRGWQDFGTGALGDMACHTANMPFRALRLEYPTSIEAESSGINKETYPKWSRIRFEFPARSDMPPLSFFWYDGGQKPPEDITSGLDLARRVEGSKKRKKVEVLKSGDVPGSGCLIVGDKGALFSPDDYGAAYRIFPEEDFKDYKGPPETIPRLSMEGGTDKVHHQEWIRAIKESGKPYSSFDYAALLTETILLGNIALRTGKKLDWDGPNMKAKNCPEAEQFIRREYRKGYTL
jgi:predicted dehydrogenase